MSGEADKARRRLKLKSPNEHERKERGTKQKVGDSRDTLVATINRAIPLIPKESDFGDCKSGW